MQNKLQPKLISQNDAPRPNRMPSALKEQPAQPKTPPTGEQIKEYEELERAKMMEEDILKAYRREFQEVVRKSIKIKVRNEGIMKTFGDFYGCTEMEGSKQHTSLQQMADTIDSDEWGKLSGQETYALFVTLSPEPGTCTAEALHATFEDLFAKKQKKGIHIAMWSIENFTENMERPHVHCLLMLNKEDPSGQRSRVKAMLIRNLKCYKTKCPQYLKIQAVSQKKYQSKVDYVHGKKTDPRKQHLVSKDRKWRKEIGLQDYYSFPPSVKSGHIYED